MGAEGIREARPRLASSPAPPRTEEPRAPMPGPSIPRALCVPAVPREIASLPARTPRTTRDSASAPLQREGAMSAPATRERWPARPILRRGGRAGPEQLITRVAASARSTAPQRVFLLATASAWVPPSCFTRRSRSCLHPRLLPPRSLTDVQHPVGAGCQQTCRPRWSP